MPGGRKPFEITQEVLKKVEKLAAQGLTQEQIGRCIGISHETMAKKKRQNNELVEALKNGRAKGIAQVTNKLFQKAMEGDNTAIIFYLKNRDRENWQDVNKQEHKVDADVNVGRLTEKRKAEILEEMRKNANVDEE